MTLLLSLNVVNGAICHWKILQAQILLLRGIFKELMSQGGYRSVRCSRSTCGHGCMLEYPVLQMAQVSKLPYLGMRSSYAKARRRENCRANVVIWVFALVSHQDASHSAASPQVTFERLKIEHLLKGKLLRAVLVGFEHRHGNLEPVRNYSFIRYDWKITELACLRLSKVLYSHQSL